MLDRNSSNLFKRFLLFSFHLFTLPPVRSPLLVFLFWVCKVRDKNHFMVLLVPLTVPFLACYLLALLLYIIYLVFSKPIIICIVVNSFRHFFCNGTSQPAVGPREVIIIQFKMFSNANNMNQKLENLFWCYWIYLNIFADCTIRDLYWSDFIFFSSSYAFTIVLDQVTMNILIPLQ